MSPGSIYYLPPFSQISPSTLTSKMRRRLTSMQEGIFGHPVLIMSVNERRSEASILIITSAGGKAFQNLHPNLQIYGVPIWPNDPHPLNNSLVCLKNEWALPKECYINTIRQYTVPSSQRRLVHVHRIMQSKSIPFAVAKIVFSFIITRIQHVQRLERR
ncbi:MAG: hypothetical protein L6R42_007464 [Xanthoria sp. 1 TBL-2021]|nr:MAG: hypothetical protein L6R42_007464 [Xanthoria sp. 1 TBL-2021]